MRLVKVVRVELGGRERGLRLDMGAALWLKRTTGLSLLKGEINETTIIEEEVALAVVVACLRHEDAELTVDSFADGLVMRDVFKALEIIMDELLPEFMPEVEAAGEDKNDEVGPQKGETAVPTSPSSGPSPESISDSQNPSSGGALRAS